MVVPAVGQDRGHEPDADEQHAEGLTHTTSQEEKVIMRICGAMLGFA
jgi:hypothetical protein